MSNQAQTILRNLNIQTTYKLKYPVVLADGTTLTELDIRRPKGRDQRLFEEKQFDFEKEAVKISRFYIQQLTKLVPEDIDDLDGADINALNEIILALITEGKSPKSVS